MSATTIEISGNNAGIIVIDGKQYKIDIKDIDIVLTPVDGPPVPDPDPPKEPIEKGTVKPGGWGGNKDPKTWKAVSMKKPKDQFKVVDDRGINIATNFTTKEAAQLFIDWSVGHGVPVPTPDPNPDHPPTPTGTKDQFGILKIAPDKPGGKTNTSFDLEEKERNYASGKPSEWSVEYTADLGEKLSDIEVTYYCKINGFKTNEADNISTKILGPSHSDGAGRSWYIGELATDGSSSKTLMTETPHPVYFENNQNALFTVGESIVGKWVGIKMVTYLINGGKDRRLEMWLDWPVADIANPPNKWREYWCVDDIGQLDHAHFIQPTGSLVCSRIDGVKEGDPPEFKYASVREVIAPAAGGGGGGGNLPPQPPIEPPVKPPVTPPSPGTEAGQDKYGVKMIHSDGTNINYNHSKNFRADGKRFDIPVGKTMVNCELTGYFADHDGIDDEVSGKQRGGKHSDGSFPKTYDMGVDIKSGACRYRTEDKHPEYEAATAVNTLASGLGVGLKDKFIGYKFICRNILNDKAVNLQIWQDVGNNEGDKPANEWKQIANWVVKDPLWVVVADDHQETLRIDDDNGCPNLAYKWISVAEIKS